jgi:uncharacterized protein YodC (DUF2158 family)
MATKFKRGDLVKVNTVVPSGEVEAFRMDEDGVVWCRMTWVDVEGNQQTRWFKEDDLVNE